jgi:hypothetical protein
MISQKSYYNFLNIEINSTVDLTSSIKAFDDINIP